MRTSVFSFVMILLVVGAVWAEPRIDGPEPASQAPFYTTPTEAQQAATDDQKIVIEFYTGW